MLKKYCGYCGSKLSSYKTAAALNYYPIDGTYHIVVEQSRNKYAILSFNSGTNFSSGGKYYIGELDLSLTNPSFLTEINKDRNYSRLRGSDDSDKINALLNGVLNATKITKEAVSTDNAVQNKVSRAIVTAILADTGWKSNVDDGEEFGNQADIENAFKGVSSAKGKGSRRSSSKAKQLASSGVNFGFNDAELMPSKIMGYLKSNGFVILRGVQNATSGLAEFTKLMYKDEGKSESEGYTRSYLIVSDEKKKELKKAVKKRDTVANLGYVSFFKDANLQNKAEPKEGEPDPNEIVIDNKKYSVVVVDVNPRM